ncbi:MAG: hypothetical protein AMXMBFR44_1180 [Candidatus Campbellbacteria bacterium]
MRLLILTQKMDVRDPVLGFFHRWVEAFAKQCESIIVVCLYEGEHHLPENVRVLSLGKEGGVSRMKYVRRFYTYIWRERKNYDAVYAHMNQIYVILGALVWRCLGKTVSWWYAHGAVSTSMRLAEKLTNIAFTSSPDGFRIASRKVHIVGQGIDTELFKPMGMVRKDGALRIVSVGRISSVKHINVLIDALSIVLQTNPEAELYLYGLAQTEGEKRYQKGLEDLAGRRGIADKVHFAGAVVYTDLPHFLAEADVFAQASQTGSMDKAVLEALAMNIPVVSTNIAFSSVLGVVVADQDAESIATVIKQPQVKHNTHLYVQQEHSLPVLIQKKMAVLRLATQHRI